MTSCWPLIGNSLLVMENFARNSSERASTTTISSVEAEERVRSYLDSKVHTNLRLVIHNDVQSDRKVTENISIHSSDKQVGDSNFTTVNQFYYAKVTSKFFSLTFC